MIHANPPTRYRHWTGRMASMPEADGWPYPTVEHDHDTGTATWTIPPGDWTHLGFAPTPRTRWGRFWHHWHHGRLMGYPALSVLAFCLREVGWIATPDVPASCPVPAPPPRQPDPSLKGYIEQANDGRF